MVGRLFLGLCKGLLVGGLVGFALGAAFGTAGPPAWLAYIAAVVTGALVGLVAGKPIWAKDARIEAGAKAVAGALLGAGLLFAARRWLAFPLPFSLGAFGEAQPTLGLSAIPSLALVAAVLGAFYEADNTPSAEGASGGTDSPREPARVAPGAPSSDDEFLDDEPSREERRRS
jgi:hypothetical protein